MLLRCFLENAILHIAFYWVLSIYQIVLTNCGKDFVFVLHKQFIRCLFGYF